MKENAITHHKSVAADKGKIWQREKLLQEMVNPWQWLRSAQCDRRYYILRIGARKSGAEGTDKEHDEGETFR